MYTDKLNEFGKRYGYPIYVMEDGTFFSSRISGKRVLFTVEGPIDTSSYPKYLEAQKKELPRRTTEVIKASKDSKERTGFRGNGGFLKNLVDRFIKSENMEVSVSDTPSEYTDYEEAKETAPTRVNVSKGESVARTDHSGNGIFRHHSKDWSVEAQGVSAVKTAHIREGDREMYVANYVFN